MRTIRGIWAVVGIIFLVLGLPSIRSDVAGWASWLDWLRDAPWQWVFLGIGLAIITLAEGPVFYRRYARRALVPAAAPAAPAAAAPTAPKPQIAPRDAVWAEQTRRRRVADLVTARQLLTREFRKAFDNYIETLLERRRELHADMADQPLHELREEYRVLQRLVAATYRRVRDHYRRFIEAEPDYDRRHELFDPPEPGLPVDYPLTKWWKPITFDEAVDTWANADDAHIRHYLDRERAVLDAFDDWLTQADNHPLADDIEVANREDEEILMLTRRQQEAQEAERERGQRHRSRAGRRARCAARACLRCRALRHL